MTDRSDGYAGFASLLYHPYARLAIAEQLSLQIAWLRWIFLVYGEIIEYLKSQSDFARRRTELRSLINQSIPAYGLTYTIVERCTELRRALRPPFGPGLIGDINTLIAATAFENDLTLITADSDYLRVPGSLVQHIPFNSLR